MHGGGEVVDPTAQTHGPQVTVHRARIDQHAGIQQVLRVEGGLDLTEGLKCSGGVHRWEQLRPRSTVAVLARQRAAIASNQLGRFFDESPITPSSALLGQWEVDADVHASVAEVTVRQPLQSMINKQLVEVSQV